MEKYFHLSTNRPPCAYRPGEEIIFTLEAREDGKPTAFETTAWELKGDFGLCESGKAKGQGTLTFRAHLDKPGFIYLHAWAEKENGEPDKEVCVFHGGAGVGVTDIVSSTVKPSDYDTFWERTKAEMEAVEPILLSKKPLPADPEHPMHDIFDVRIACAGGMPVSGILTIPRGRERLPARVIYQGYGVKSAWHDFDDNEINLCINAHGIENDMPDAFYAFLSAGRLARYGFDEQQNKHPDTCYFKAMMQRAGQAACFLMTLPQWDGKNLFVRGGSQGAVQSLQASWLVPQINELNIFVPWLCDVNAAQTGRLCGWGEMQTSAIPYFDSTLRAATLQNKKITITAGIGDYTAPPAGVAALYNALQTEKSLTYVQGMEHLTRSPEAEEYTI